MKEISIEEIQKAIDECSRTYKEHEKACEKVALMIPQVEVNENNHVFMQAGDGLVIVFADDYSTPITAELIAQLRKTKSRKYRFALLEDDSI